MIWFGRLVYERNCLLAISEAKQARHDYGKLDAAIYQLTHYIAIPRMPLASPVSDAADGNVSARNHPTSVPDTGPTVRKIATSGPVIAH